MKISLVLLASCFALSTAEKGHKFLEAGAPNEQKSFRRLDGNSDKHVDKNEFLYGVWHTNGKPRHVSIHFFRQADADGNGVLQGAETDAAEGLKEDHTKKTFKEFITDLEANHPDWNPRGKDTAGFGGEIGWKDYQHAVWLNWQDKTTEQFQTVYDTDKDGRLNKKEFHAAYEVMEVQVKKRLWETYRHLSVQHKDSADVSSDEWFDMVWSERFDKVKMRAQEFFEETDTNNDGMISILEYADHLGTKVGKLSEEQQQKFQSWAPEGKVDEGDPSDTNSVTVGKTGAAIKISLEEIMKHIDEEYGKFSHKTFTNADKNDDGYIDEKEFYSADAHGFHYEL